MKCEDDLDNSKQNYSHYFRKYVTEDYIVTYLINTNHELFVTYNYYQGLLKSLRNRDKHKFFSIIDNHSSDISIYAKKCNKTLLDMKKYLANAFDYDFSNGKVEETNNVIKQIIHTAYRYRKFAHLKASVMLIKDFLNPLAASCIKKKCYKRFRQQFIYH